MWLLRPLPSLVLVVAACLAAAGAVTLLDGDGGAAPQEAQPPSHGSATPARAVDASAVRALTVLRRWDRARAAAYASGDVAALRRLYVPGGAAGRKDVRTLRAYADRGLAVERLQLQRFEVAVLRASGSRLRVRVVERLARATVVAAGRETALPRGRPERRVITLLRGEGGWRVATVHAVSAAPRRSGR